TDSLEVEQDKSLLNQAFGVQTDVVTPEEIERISPLVDLTAGGALPVLGASYPPPGPIARRDSVVWGYAWAATRRGVYIHEGTPVTGIRVDDGGCTGIETGAGPVSAGVV